MKKYFLGIVVLFVSILFFQSHFLNEKEKIFDLFYPVSFSNEDGAFFLYQGEYFETGEKEDSLQHKYDVFLSPGEAYRGFYVLRSTYSNNKSFIFDLYNPIESEGLKIDFDETNPSFINFLGKEFLFFELSVSEFVELGDYEVIVEVAPVAEPLEGGQNVGILISVANTIKLHVVEDSSLREAIDMRTVIQAQALSSLRGNLSYLFGFISFIILLYLFFKK